MATITVSVRYHIETDTYYMQIKGSQYSRLNKKIKKISAHMDHLQDEKHMKERARLAEYRRFLVQERRQALYYVVISASDIPENAHIRPIYDLTGQILTAEPERYAELLDKLQGLKCEGDEC